MTDRIVPLLTRGVPTGQAAHRLWEIRRLLREGGIDRLAALTALEVLAAHANRRIAGLAIETECDVADRCAGVTGIYAR